MEKIFLKEYIKLVKKKNIIFFKNKSVIWNYIGSK